MALALHSDKDAPIDAWLKGGSRQAICRPPSLQQRLHGGSTSDHADDVNAMRTAVKALRQTVT